LTVEVGDGRGFRGSRSDVVILRNVVVVLKLGAEAGALVEAVGSMGSEAADTRLVWRLALLRRAYGGEWWRLICR
jgi:hypothetical protein